MVETTFYGEIKNGHIVLPEDVKLPDTAKVCVIVSEIEAQPRSLRMPTPRLINREQAARLKKEMVGIEEDDTI